MKVAGNETLTARLGSLPLRECGLKVEKIDNGKFLRRSLPLRECGLKVVLLLVFCQTFRVTPLAGVWIERLKSRSLIKNDLRHSPCGSVD